MYVINGIKFGFRLSLGCFIGNENECILAIEKQYSGKSKLEYIKKVKSAFEIAKERYTQKV